jgi:HD-GYP domain-containing protein (c-di-GMP phosphodiesterase class II)
MDKKLENGIINIAKSMVSAASNLSLYTAEHLQVKRHLETTLACILDLLKDRKEISFVVIEGDLIVDNHPVGSSIFLSKFAEKLQGKGIGGLTFTAGITEAELMDFIKLLAPTEDADREVSSSPHIKVGKVEVKMKGKTKQKGGNISARGVHEFMEIYENMEKRNKIDVIGMQNIIANILTALKDESNPIRALAPMKSFDEYTFTHSVNVCILTMAQAMRLGIEEQLLHDVGIAALLHDVGKLFVPEEILSKDGKLNEGEWKIIREHPAKGAIYLMDIPGIPGLSVVIAFEHHMRYDFSGYPEVRQGWKQNYFSQMTALADVFDAMRSSKRYSSPYAEEEILSILMQKAGKEYNPFLVDNFIKMFSSTQRVKGSEA